MLFRNVTQRVRERADTNAHRDGNGLAQRDGDKHAHCYVNQHADND